MSAQLPERPSFEYLKKLAKERLPELRKSHPGSKLAAAQLGVAREYGFASWRALKTEVERRNFDALAPFFEACTKGDIAALSALLAKDPSLARAVRSASHGSATYGGWTGLHSAAKAGHGEAVRLLLAHGADPNAREAGDNTYPLHWAAAGGHAEAARALLDAGGDVHGIGDEHALDTIGWATYFHPHSQEHGDPETIALLIDRGARHHIFSALAIGDPQLVRRVAAEKPEALSRRLSSHDGGLSPLHFAMNRKRYDLLDLLIELGADLEAADKTGQTPLAAAMLRGDREAMARLQAAGARVPDATGAAAASNFREGMAALAKSVKKGVPMIAVPDIARTLEWYVSIGFEETGRYEDDGVVNFGMLEFGGSSLMLVPGGKQGDHEVSLWFYTDQIDSLYHLIRSRRLAAAQAELNGGSGARGIEFEQDIENMFYGARQFAIRDLNGYCLYFIQ